MNHPHILLAVSAHGYGHLSQVAPVVNALRAQLPKMQLTVQGAFARPLVEGRIEGRFELITEAADVGFAMHGPTEIDWPKTLAWHQDFHRQWDQRLETEKALLRQHSVDLVIADVPYLPLAAAQQLGIPAVAYSSLNWADCLLENPRIAAALQPEIERMRSIYAQADLFIQPEPSMPMAWLGDNRAPVAPVYETPRNRRQALDHRLGLDPSKQLILVSLGGIPMSKKLHHWPRIEQVQWLVDAKDFEPEDNVFSTEGLDWPFPDLIGSADLLLTKPGYGTFTEAARCGIPVLNIAREDWAESRYLIQWLQKFVALETVPLRQVRDGDIREEIVRLLAEGRRPGIKASGIGQAVELLLTLMDRH